MLVPRSMVPCTMHFVLRFSKESGLIHKWLWLCKVRAVYIMDHEIIPCSPKICDWPLNLFWGFFSLHQGKNIGVIMELEVPQRPIFRPTLSSIMFNKFVIARGKRGPLVAKVKGTWQRNNVWIDFLSFLILFCWPNITRVKRKGGRRGEDKTWKKT